MIDKLGQLKTILNCQNNKLCPICKAWIEAIINEMEAEKNRRFGTSGQN